MLAVAALALLAQPLQFNFDSNSGLSLSVSGVPVVRGSWFQYHTPTWSKGYFSSSSAWAVLKNVDSDTVQATWDSEDHLTHAVETLHREGGKLHVHYAFDWAGDSPVKIELTAGMLWAPALQKGSLTADDKPTRPLASQVYGSQSMDERRYGTEAAKFSFKEPFGELSATGSTPLAMFDARAGYKQDWAEKSSLYWLGTEELSVEKGHTTTVDVEWSVSSEEPPTTTPGVVPSLSSVDDPDAYDSPEVHPPLIPQPRQSLLDWGHPLEITGAWAYPAGRFLFVSEFLAALAREFELPPVTPKTHPVNIDGGVSKLGLPPGSYKLVIRPTGVSVVGERDEGLRYGLQRIARLAFVKNGKLYLPTGEIDDQPVTEWRGVHLFVGPHALEFQKKLWERVLLPMGFNRVVLQCERTAWKSLPGTETSRTMTREDLAKLFAYYRSIDVDPIPLIESFGHDEWLFANGQNLDIAMDPKVPYAVDPRKPRTKELMEQLWGEAIELLHPGIIHIGMDEVDMRGFPGDEQLKTKLWAMQMETLAGIAKKNQVQLMLWGDQMLGPTEAIDAAMGDTSADAASRRTAVPRDSFVADWHYKAEPNPTRYQSSISIFKKEGLVPIASTWYQPENIRGFDLEAVANRLGTLQTTWAGYESDEAAMTEHIKQFEAMVLSGDYSWSGRQDDLKDLDYDFHTVFDRLYFGKPALVAQQKGKCLGVGDGPLTRLGSVDFRLGAPVQLASIAVVEARSAPTSLSLPVSVSGKRLSIALDSLLPAGENEAVGQLEIVLSTGRTLTQPLVYGRNVRAFDDPKSCPFAERAKGLSVLTIELGSTPVTVKSLRIQQQNSYSGLRLHGVTAY